MKTPILTALSLLLALTGAASAQASSTSKDVQVFADFHFSKQAFGKEVTGVYVHAGVLTREHQVGAGTSNDFESWQDVKHLALADRDDHFSGKAVFNAHEYLSSGPRTEIGGLMVQYWVYFKDGSSLVTVPSLARVAGDFRITIGAPEYAGKVRAAVERFQNSTDSADTSCLLVNQQYLR